MGSRVGALGARFSEHCFPRRQAAQGAVLYSLLDTQAQVQAGHTARPESVFAE